MELCLSFGKKKVREIFFRALERLLGKKKKSYRQWRHYCITVFTWDTGEPDSTWSFTWFDLAWAHPRWKPWPTASQPLVLIQDIYGSWEWTESLDTHQRQDNGRSKTQICTDNGKEKQVQKEICWNEKNLTLQLVSQKMLENSKMPASSTLKPGKINFLPSGLKSLFMVINML